MKYYKYIIFLTVVVSALIAKAGGDEQFISPGIKLGYTFGKGGGFTFGAEISYNIWYKKAAQGVVLGYDICTYDSIKGLSKLYVGYRLSNLLLGADLGPTIIFDGEKRHYGATLTPSIGFVIPHIYYSYTMVLSQQRDIDEWGLKILYPLELKNHPIPDFSNN